MDKKEIGHTLLKALTEILEKSDKARGALHAEYKQHAEAGNHAEAASAAMKLHHYHSEALMGEHGNNGGDRDEYHDRQQKQWHTQAKQHALKGGVKKGELGMSKKSTCRCSSYSFPHRSKGGKCKGE